jgi:hypothetical protein
VNVRFCRDDVTSVRRSQLAFGLLMAVAQGVFRVPSFQMSAAGEFSRRWHQMSICLLGTRRTKEIIELVHQSA